MASSIVTASDAIASPADTANRAVQSFPRKASDAFLVPTVVQTAKNAATATSVTVTFGSTPTPGNTLVFGVAWNVATSTITPPTGVTLIGSNTTGHGIATYQRVVQAGDGTGWTFGISVSGALSIVAYEVSGVDNTTPVNGHGENAVTAQVLTTASVIPTKLNCLPIAFFAEGNRNAFTGLNGDWVNDASNTTIAWFTFGCHGPGTTNTTSGISATITLTGGTAASNMALVLLNSVVVQPAETLNRTLGVHRSITDALGTLGETLTRSVQSFTRTVTDGLSAVTETLTRIQSFGRSVSDSLGAIGETLTRLTGQVRTVTDGLGSLSETLTRSVQSFARSSTDAVAGVGDSLTRAVHLVRGSTDGIGAITESLTNAARHIVVTATDAILGVTDTVSRSAQGFIRSTADALQAVNESVVRSSQHYLRAVNDVVSSVTESLTRVTRVSRGASDTIGPISDVLVRVIRSYYYLTATINAVVSLSASILSSIGLTSRVATTVPVSVSIPAQVTLPVTIQASIVLPVRIT